MNANPRAQAVIRFFNVVSCRACLCGGTLFYTLLSFNSTAAAPDSLESPDRSLESSNSYLATVSAYREQIANLSGDDGPFDPDLLEPLTGLTNAHIEAGDYNEALALLNQRLQIHRMNQGLYSREQLPVIEQMIRLNSLNQDWLAVDGHVSHLYWLYQRDETVDPRHRLEGLREIARWHLTALNLDEPEQDSEHLLAYRDISDEALAMAEEAYGEDSVELAEHLYRSARSYIYIGLAISLGDEVRRDLLEKTEGISSSPAMIAGPSAANSAASIEAAYGGKSTTVINRVFRQNLRRAAGYIDRIRDNQALAGNTEAEAMALIYKGDAVLLRQQYEINSLSYTGTRRGSSGAGNAISHYRDAMELLAQSEVEEEKIAAFFECPVVLPVSDFVSSLEQALAANAESRLCASEAAEDAGNAVFVMSDVVPGPTNVEAPDFIDIAPLAVVTADVSFSVQPNGQASRVELLSVEPDGTRNRVDAETMVETMQFRPAITDGRATATDDVQLRLKMTDD